MVCFLIKRHELSEVLPVINSLSVEALITKKAFVSADFRSYIAVFAA